MCEAIGKFHSETKEEGSTRVATVELVDPMIAFGPDGDLYVPNWKNNSIVKFDSDLVDDGTTMIDSNAGLNQPEQVAFDAGTFSWPSNATSPPT